MNQVILIGNLAADPESRTTQSGIACCTFRLAVNRRYKGADGQRETDFINCVAWRQCAELCSKYLAKGRKVGVTGSLQTRTYQAQDGSKRYATEVVVEQVEFLTARNESAETPSTPSEVTQQFTPIEDSEESGLPF
jgi:single-strand DNA-binding protein